MSKRPSSVRSRSSSIGPPSSRLSRLPIREQPQSNRAKSSLRPGAEKKSVERNFTRSKSTLGEQCALNRQRSGSSLRLGTPLSQNLLRSVGKSPLSSARKDNRPISDKKWQYGQLVKVRNFVVQNLPSIDHNSIKAGMHTDMFIILTSELFKIMDKRIIITRENYVEEVPSRLRLFRYPTNVKPSLMKAVNIPHSWSSVIAILGWLTDLVLEVTRPDEITDSLPDIIAQCFMQRYGLWNMGKEDTADYDVPLKELEKTLVKYYGNDPKELKKLEEQQKNLEASAAEYKEIKKKKSEQIKALREQINVLETKCTTFSTATKKFEEQILQKKDAVYKKIKKINKEIEDLFVTEEEIKNRVKNQPYTMEQEKELMKEIENLQNVVKLKEERCQQQKDLVHTYDHQLSDLNQKMRESAYKYNNIISEIELADPADKELHIRESGFARHDTETHLKEIRQLLEVSISKTKNELTEYERKLQDIKENYATVQEQLFSINKKHEEIVKANAEAEIMRKHKQSKLSAEKQSALDKLHSVQNQLLELKSRRPDIASLEKELQQTKEACELAEQEHEELKTKALEFFIKLDAQISNNLVEYMKIMDNINISNAKWQGAVIEDSKLRAEYCQKLKGDLMRLKYQSGKQRYTGKIVYMNLCA